MTEPMIPLSVIDALMSEFKAREKYDPLEETIKNYLKYSIIPYLEEIKKEATLVQPIEQKIKDRIQILKQKEHLTYINESIPSWIIINELEYLLND